MMHCFHLPDQVTSRIPDMNQVSTFIHTSIYKMKIKCSGTYFEPLDLFRTKFLFYFIVLNPLNEYLLKCKI